MGWCPYSCLCQEALRKQQHENWRSKALLREAWLTAYQQYSRWQHVATTTTYSAVSGSFFSTCVFLIVLCNFWGHFGIIWGRNWPVQFGLAIHWCGYQTHWAVCSSIENGGNYVSWKYLVQKSENILVKIVFDQICLHSFFILRFVCNQPGNESPKNWIPFWMAQLWLWIQEFQARPASAEEASVSWVKRWGGKWTDPLMFWGKALASWTKWKSQGPNRWKVWPFFLKEFFFVEDFGI